MAISTFMGLETNKRGLTAQQTALYTVGHNISNANTVGYTRQRVNLEATTGFPTAGMNSPKMAGNLGTGVDSQSIQRIRNEFIDKQYRQETNNLGYWSNRTETISQLEDVFSEPSAYGINQAYDDFYTALQTLSTTPENAAARQVVAERGAHLADSFNYSSKQLTQVQTNLKQSITTELKNINSILKQINDLNRQIKTVEPNGYVPNELYDARDLLLDSLSEYVPITVSKVASGGLASPVAEGSLNVFMKLEDGSTVQLVNAEDLSYQEFQGVGYVEHFEKDADGNYFVDANGNKISEGFIQDVIDSTGDEFTPITGFVLTQKGGASETEEVEGTEETEDESTATTSTEVVGTLPTIYLSQLKINSGKIQSLIQDYGYVTLTPPAANATEDATVVADEPENEPLPAEDTISQAIGTVLDKINELNQLAREFAAAFNTIHQAGFTLTAKDAAGNETLASEQGGLFFVATGDEDGSLGTEITAANLKVLDDIIKNKNYNLIAASGSLDGINDAGIGQNEEGNGKNALALSNLKSKTLEALNNASTQNFYEGMVADVGVLGEQANRLAYNSATLQLSISNNRDSVISVSLDEEMTDMIKFQQAYNASARMMTTIDETLDKIINGMGRVGL